MNDIKDGWVLNDKNMTLYRNDVWPVYEINLEEINSNAQMLDWIFHIYNKNETHAYELISAFKLIFDPCSNCCSFGEELKFSGTKLVKEYLGHWKRRK